MTIDAGETLKRRRIAAGMSQMVLAMRIGVTLPAVSGWERNLYRPRRPTAQRLDDELNAGGDLLAAFGYAPLPSPGESSMPASTTGHIERLEGIVADLSRRVDEVQRAVEQLSGETGHDDSTDPRRTSDDIGAGAK